MVIARDVPVTECTRGRGPVLLNEICCRVDWVPREEPVAVDVYRLRNRADIRDSSDDHREYVESADLVGITAGIVIAAKDDELGLREHGRRMHIKTSGRHDRVIGYERSIEQIT